MRTRILPLLITMLFALSLASNAAANENSKMTPGTIAVVNNPDSNDRLNLRTMNEQIPKSIQTFL